MNNLYTKRLFTQNVFNQHALWFAYLHGQNVLYKHVENIPSIVSSYMCIFPTKLSELKTK